MGPHNALGTRDEKLAAEIWPTVWCRVCLSLRVRVTDTMQVTEFLHETLDISEKVRLF